MATDDSRLKLVADALPVYVAYYDRERICLVANQAYERLAGGHVVGTPMATHLGPAAAAIEPLLTAALAGQSVEDTVPTIFPAGRRCVQVTAVPDGNPALGATLCLVDVSAEHRARQARHFFGAATQVLESDGEPAHVWRRLAEAAVAEYADWCTIHIRASEEVALAAIAVTVDPNGPALDHRKVAAGSIIDDVLNGRPARLLAPGANPFDDQKVTPCQTGIVVPLIGRDGVVAALTMASVDPTREFGADCLAMAEDLSRRFSLAASNARLYRAEQRARKAAERAAERTTRLQAITAQLVGALDAEAIGTIIVGQAVAAMRAYAGMLMMASADGTRLELLQSHGYDDALLDNYRSIEIDRNMPASAAFRTGRPIWVHGPADYARDYPELAAGVPRTAALCAVPLVTQDRPVAVFGLAFAEAQAFTPEDQSFLYALARQGAQALERARLHRDARDADRRKDEFLAMLSHELRNPLAPMLTGIQLLRESPDQARAAHLLDTFERQVHHLSRLVDDLLDVSRVTRGKIELRRARIDAAAVARTATDGVRHIMEARRHHLSVEIVEGAWVDADPVRLEQVFTNLLNNAAKYTEPGGKISFMLTRSGQDVVARVRDSGMGIAADLLPQVFEPFMQASRALDRSQGGLGIGLTLVKRIAEMHGGRANVQSAGIGKGSEFTVSIPAASPPEVALNGVPVLVPARSAAVAGSSLKVLVVDDNADAAESLAQLLTLWGHRVEVASDGPSALRIADTMSPELVLLDIGLPGMDGYQVAAALRATDPRTAGTHVVAVSGYGQARDRERSREAGFDAHLTKPVDIARLRQLMSDIARAP